MKDQIHAYYQKYSTNISKPQMNKKMSFGYSADVDIVVNGMIDYPLSTVKLLSADYSNIDYRNWINEKPRHPINQA